MGIIEAFLETLFQEILWGLIKRLGSFIRWLFLRNKYSYDLIYKQDWNGRVGLLTICLIIILILGLFKF